MRETGSTDLKIWLPDGTNYAGQDSLRGRQDRLADSLAQIYAALDDDQRLLLEYKIFEPYFYTMDVPDWGTSLLHCLALGERAKVILDTGHHAPGTNIEFIVMQLLRQDRLGAFDFNSRYYADDDLIVGSADPFQLFRIMFEIVDAERAPPGVRGELHARPVPQHRGEDPRPDPVGDERASRRRPRRCWSTRTRSQRRSRPGDVLGAHGVLMDAYDTDVRGILADRREARGLPRDPLAAFAESGYARAGRRRAGRRHPGPLGRLTIPSDPDTSFPSPITDFDPWSSEHHDRQRGRAGPGRPVEPARRRPAQHQLRRREHLREGHRDRPGHRASRWSWCGSRDPAVTWAR